MATSHILVNPPASLKSAVEFLTSAMRDFMKANVCAIRLSIAADRMNRALEGCTCIAERTKIAKSYPELLRAGIKFLTVKQPVSEHVAMMDRLTTCRCDFSQHGMGDLHKPTMDGRVDVDATVLVFDAVTTVSNCLVLALADLTQHKFRSGSGNARERPWPQGPEDLLPPGPKDSLDGLELWVAAAPLGYTVFQLMGQLARFHVPFAREVFQSPHFTIALAWPLQPSNSMTNLKAAILLLPLHPPSYGHL